MSRFGLSSSGIARLDTIPYIGALLALIAALSLSQLTEEPAQARLQFPAPIAHDPSALLPLSEGEATDFNAKAPIAEVRLTAADPFFPGTALSGIQYDKAVDCLTAAVYYEAGAESQEGRRAVAQVVLNRTRHPAYPNSICGVVYQGSNRKTGCQFTFTCDGSLARRPSSTGWAIARATALSALQGSVYPSVGHATHYHADYVVPYWSSSLDRIAKVGAHIFYQFRGTNGTRAAFTQSYAGVELADFSASTLSEGEKMEVSFPPEDGNLATAFSGSEGKGPLPEESAAKLDKFGLLDYREGRGIDAAMDRGLKDLDAVVMNATKSRTD